MQMHLKGLQRKKTLVFLWGLIVERVWRGGGWWNRGQSEEREDEKC